MPWDEWPHRRARRRDGRRAPRGRRRRPGRAACSSRASRPTAASLAFLSDERGWLNLWVADVDGDDAASAGRRDAEHGDPSWGLGQRSFAWSPDGTRDRVHSRNERGFGSLARRRRRHRRRRRCSARACTAACRGGAIASRACGRERARRRRSSCTTRRDRPRDRRPRARSAGSRRSTSPSPRRSTGRATTAARCTAASTVRPLRRPPAPIPPPLLVWIHGGPTGQSPVACNTGSPFFLERGWAVLFPDHRGSTGHGRAYAQAMAGRWGDLDVATAPPACAPPRPNGGGATRAAWCRWAARPGGFTVLNLLAHHPRSVRGRHRPVRRRRPVRPRRDDAPLRGALPPLDRRPAPRGGRRATATARRSTSPIASPRRC